MEQRQEGLWNGLSWHRDRDGICIGQCMEDVTSVEVDDYIEGIPVTKVGKRAFAGRKELREVVIGRHVTELENYAFYDSRNLERLELWDRVKTMGDGTFRNCEKLHRICLHVENGRDSCIRDILSEVPGEVRVEIRYPDGCAELFFPEYDIEYFEVTFVLISMFRQETYGSGAAFRLCLQGAKIDYRTYDQHFDQATREDRGPAAAAIAMLRLRSPRELLPVYREAYESWLKEHAADAVTWILEEGEESLLTFLEQRGIFTPENLESCMTVAREKGDPAVLARLLHIRLTMDQGTSAEEPAVRVRRRYEL